MIREALFAAATLVLLSGLAFAAMRVSTQTAKRVWLLAFIVVVDGGMAMMSAHAFLAKWGFRGDDGRSGLELMMDGTAERPFVYRRLAPELVRVATDLVMTHVSPTRLDDFAQTSPLKRYRVATEGVLEHWSTRKAVAVHAAYGLVWAALLGVTLVSAALVRTVRGGTVFDALVTATLGTALIPLIFVGGGYIYDAMELLIWTSLLVVALRGWSWATLPLFLLLAINKESALLGVPALTAIIWRERGRVSAIKWTVPLVLIGAAWFVYVRQRYATNPGQPMESWLALNLAFWTDPRSYLRFGTYFSPGLPSPRGANVLLLILAFLPFKFGWKHTPSSVRWATLVTAAIFLPLFIKAGYMDEVRALSMLFPLMFLVAVQGVRALFDTPDPVGNLPGAN